MEDEKVEQLFRCVGLELENNLLGWKVCQINLKIK